MMDSNSNFELNTNDDNTYRTWLRLFAGADVCISPLGIMVIGYYLYQAKLYIKLWSEPLNDDLVAIVNKTPKYEAILRYTGNLENATSKAAQLYGIFVDINDRCGLASKEKTSASLSYIAIPLITNLITQISHLFMGLAIIYSTRSDTDSGFSFLRWMFSLLICIIVLESVSNHLMYFIFSDRVCPAFNLSKLAYFQLVVFITFFEVPHLIAVYKYMHVVGLSELEQRRIDRKLLKKPKKSINPRHSLSSKSPLKIKSITNGDDRKRRGTGSNLKMDTMYTMNKGSSGSITPSSAYEATSELPKPQQTNEHEDPTNSKALHDTLANNETVKLFISKLNELNTKKTDEDAGKEASSFQSIPNVKITYHDDIENAAFTSASGDNSTVWSTTSAVSAKDDENVFSQSTNLQQIDEETKTPPLLTPSDIPLTTQPHDDNTGEDVPEHNSSKSFSSPELAPSATSRNLHAPEPKPIDAFTTFTVQHNTPKTTPKPPFTVNKPLVASMPKQDAMSMVNTRTSVIAPGHATARITVFRPKTRRVVERESTPEDTLRNTVDNREVVPETLKSDSNVKSNRK